MGFEIINKLKKEKGLTNAQIASQAGITLSTLDKITAGINTNPKLDTLQAICRVLGCRLDDFDDNKSPAPEREADINRERLMQNYEQLTDKGKEALLDYSKYQLTINKKEEEKKSIVIAAYGQSKENEEFLKEVGKKLGEIF